MFDVWVNGRMEFSDDDRRECLDTVVTIIEIANRARKNGILSLESEIQYLDSAFFKKAFTMFVDSMDSDYIRRILQNFIIAGNYKGGALLKRIVIMEGIFSIFNCENPHSMYEYTLASLFGEDFLPEYEAYCNPKINAIINPQNHVEKFLDLMKNKKLPEGISPLEDILSKANDFAIAETLKEIGGNDLRIAILGLSEPVVRKIFTNMSRRNVEQIVEDCNSLRNLRQREIINAQNKILNKIKELESTGRIVIK